MPALEELSRCQKAVLWEASGTDDNGRVTVEAAVQIDVRWVESSREAVSPQGDDVGITATVLVNQVIPMHSIMWLGALADLPSPPTNLREVIDYNEVPDIKGRKTYRTVSLMWYSDTLPALTT